MIAPSTREAVQNFPFPPITTPSALSCEETCSRVKADAKPLKNLDSRSCRDAAVSALFSFPVNLCFLFHVFFSFGYS